jgi:hypothetical protein
MTANKNCQVPQVRADALFGDNLGATSPPLQPFVVAVAVAVVVSVCSCRRRVAHIRLPLANVGENRSCGTPMLSPAHPVGEFSLRTQPAIHRCWDKRSIAPRFRGTIDSFAIFAFATIIGKANRCPTKRAGCTGSHSVERNCAARFNAPVAAARSAFGPGFPRSPTTAPFPSYCSCAPPDE